MGRNCVRLARFLSFFFSIMACVRALPAEEEDSMVGTQHRTKAHGLFKTWAEMYGLDDSNDEPPLLVEPPKGPNWSNRLRATLPKAPHLEKCAQRAAERRKLERWPEDGEPEWARSRWPEEGEQDRARSDGSHGPNPPWVRGGDHENLAKTRIAQRDIWQHQFPRNCSLEALKFAVVEWTPMALGVGSQLHFMTVALSISMEWGRILVPRPGTYGRAMHEGCKGSHHGSLTCYFFPMVSAACEQQALHLLATEPSMEIPPPDPLPRGTIDRAAEAAFRGPERVVVVSGTWYRGMVWQTKAGQARHWGSPWEKHPAQVELLGEVLRSPSREMDWMQVMWWRSQAIRFMLRWPSAYLCHLTNRARHKAYGLRVASQAIAALASQRAAISNSRLYSRAESTLLLQISLRLQASRKTLDETLWRDDEPASVRPILSVHVRQGDKGQEMRLFSFAAFMFMAERLRMRVPGLRHIWLSTEMESVIEESKQYRDWTFFYTNNPRQQGNTTFVMYESMAGLRTIVDFSFVNLIISSQCDYFVGTLGSNWNRLINELRLTNGRLNAGYVSLNHHEW